MSDPKLSTRRDCDCVPTAGLPGGLLWHQPSCASLLRPETLESAEAAAQHLANQTHRLEEWEGGTTHTCPLYEEALKVIRQREIAALEEAARAVCSECRIDEYSGAVETTPRLVEDKIHGRVFVHFFVGGTSYVLCRCREIHALIEKRKEGK